MSHHEPVHWPLSTFASFQEESVLTPVGVVTFEAALIIDHRVLRAIPEARALVALKANGSRVFQQHSGIRRTMVVMTRDAVVHGCRAVHIGHRARRVHVTGQAQTISNRHKQSRATGIVAGPTAVLPVRRMHVRYAGPPVQAQMKAAEAKGHEIGLAQIANGGLGSLSA